MPRIAFQSSETDAIAHPAARGYRPAAFHLTIAVVRSPETLEYSPAISLSACAFCPLTTQAMMLDAH
jgi:hypothetical protein